jgi:hypothetical protein
MGQASVYIRAHTRKHPLPFNSAHETAIEKARTQTVIGLQNEPQCTVQSALHTLPGKAIERICISSLCSNSSTVRFANASLLIDSICIPGLPFFFFILYLLSVSLQIFPPTIYSNSLEASRSAPRFPKHSRCRTPLYKLPYRHRATKALKDLHLQPLFQFDDSHIRPCILANCLD